MGKFNKNFLNSSDEYLTQFEDQARKTFYLLETRCKTFKKLPKNSKFKIFFHTTENTFLKLCTDSNFQVSFLISFHILILKLGYWLFKFTGFFVDQEDRQKGWYSRRGFKFGADIWWFMVFCRTLMLAFNFE